jgi:hypothetical protein
MFTYGNPMAYDSVAQNLVRIKLVMKTPPLGLSRKSSKSTFARWLRQIMRPAF